MPNSWSHKVEIGPCTLYQGDCVTVMAELAAAGVQVESCVTDPPYELGFMGKTWDAKGGVASQAETWRRAYDLLRPGGHLTAFAGSRTYHRIACAIEDAGFDIRDQLLWMYGSGWPKSHNISKGLDKAAGAERERVRPMASPAGNAGRTNSLGGGWQEEPFETLPATADAKTWAGWGSALKPAHEPIALCRRPFRGTVTGNVLEHRTGALNIDACRVGDEAVASMYHFDTGSKTGFGGGIHGGRRKPESEFSKGRWPANVLTDGSFEVLEAFPDSAREAIRFFYSAKASKEEREFGMGGEDKKNCGMMSKGMQRNGDDPAPRANIHPTVKPIDLMRWLCRLITPPAGIVLDPFMGSGTTGIAAVREGMSFVGIEQSPEYFEIARRRIEAAVRERETTPPLLCPSSPGMRATQLDFSLEQEYAQ